MMFPPCSNSGKDESGVSIETDRGELERGCILGEK